VFVVMNEFPWLQFGTLYQEAAQVLTTYPDVFHYMGASTGFMLV
jgi:hypothetical protein